ncbi:MAG: DUF2933 domain-containing protein [Armatimonadota bacterium]|nr:DUF2933 domain-containing protein [Armatimonadota bacterium]MDR7568258.1 DUF2933 domain-containing protein [Armatimonadota bacterium]MDR7602258.1 DUF2933 domain-containing protein [Armatimonadota bacterium]
MEYWLPLLLLLACPLGMGIAMRLAMRAEPRGPGGGASAADSSAGLSQVPDDRPPPDAASALRSSRLLCLDWRVLAGLVTVGVVLWLVAPAVILPALALLALLACPTSHYLMMRGEAGRSCHPPSQQPAQAPPEASGTLSQPPGEGE